MPQFQPGNFIKFFTFQSDASKKKKKKTKFRILVLVSKLFGGIDRRNQARGNSNSFGGNPGNCSIPVTSLYTSSNVLPGLPKLVYFCQQKRTPKKKNPTILVREHEWKLSNVQNLKKYNFIIVLFSSLIAI